MPHSNRRRGKFGTTALLLLSLCATAPAVAQPAANAPATISLDEALKVAAEAQKAAVGKGRNVSIVVVNREGRVILSHRMDGSSVLNLQIAESKAFTAAMIGAPTKVLEQVVDGGKPSYLSIQGALMIGGGMPVVRGGSPVAGVGVSGGTAEEDEAIASAGIAAIEGAAKK